MNTENGSDPSRKNLNPVQYMEQSCTAENRDRVHELKGKMNVRGDLMDTLGEGLC